MRGFALGWAVSGRNWCICGQSNLCKKSIEANNKNQFTSTLNETSAEVFMVLCQGMFTECGLVDQGYRVSSFAGNPSTVCRAYACSN